jgi:hypothetical protein
MEQGVVVRREFYKVVATSFLMFVFILSANIALADIASKNHSSVYDVEKISNDSTKDLILEESFELWFPEGWDQIITNADETWFQSTDEFYDGAACAAINYHGTIAQDEWLISPTVDFTDCSSASLSFWFSTSYYWHVDPNDNADIEVRISTDGGNAWSDPIWTEHDYGVFEGDQWYNVTLDLAECVGEANCKIAFTYVGLDGYHSYFDAISLDVQIMYDHDIGLIEFIAPDLTGDQGVAVTPEISVKNWGGNDEVFNINLVIELEETEVYNEVLTDVSLSSGATDNFVFPDFVPSEEAYYYLTAEVILTGDENAENNTLTRGFNTVPIMNIDFDFETDGCGFSCDNDWQYGAFVSGPEGGHSGTCGWGTLIDSTYTLGPLLSCLVTPSFALGDSAKLSFFHWYETETRYDGGNVKISNDNGENWILIYPEDGYDTTISVDYENPIMGEGAFTGTGTTWTLETFNLAAYAGDTIMFRFDYGSDRSLISGDGWYIDDFHLEYWDVTVSVDDRGILPSTFSLSQNYPNPFNARTQINFTIPVEADVRLVIYNALGQVVETLISERMAAGKHSVNWDASDVSSGIYFYKLSASGKTEVRALTLIK